MDTQKLMELLKRNPLVRFKLAINFILKKFNLYQLLHKHNFTNFNMRNTEDKSSANEINFIVKTLDQILHVMQRCFAVASRFEINITCRLVKFDKKYEKY